MKVPGNFVWISAMCLPVGSVNWTNRALIVLVAFRAQSQPGNTPGGDSDLSSTMPSGAHGAHGSRGAPARCSATMRDFSADTGASFSVILLKNIHEVWIPCPRNQHAYPYSRNPSVLRESSSRSFARGTREIVMSGSRHGAFSSTFR